MHITSNDNVAVWTGSSADRQATRLQTPELHRLGLPRQHAFILFEAKNKLPVISGPSNLELRSLVTDIRDFIIMFLAL